MHVGQHGASEVYGASWANGKCGQHGSLNSNITYKIFENLLK